MTDRPLYYIAEYEGTGPALFSNREAAKEFCDDLARAEAGGRCWDWMPEQDGAQEQWWTHADDDRPTGATGGVVTALRLDAEVTANEATGQALATETLVHATLAEKTPDVSAAEHATVKAQLEHVRRFLGRHIWEGMEGDEAAKTAACALLNALDETGLGRGIRITRTGTSED